MTLSTEQNRREKFEIIGRITAGLAHELNGPIGIALGFTELTKEMLEAAGSGLDGQSVAKVSEFLNLIESSTRRARELARKISEFSKSSPGTVEDFDLGSVVDDAAALAGPAVKGGQLEIIPRGEVAEVGVHGDPALTTQCLVQLMLGSMEALPQGGTVYWEVRSEGDDGDGQFTLTAEPWGEVPSNEWPVDDQVRSMFESQGGSLNPVTGVSMTGAGTSALAWIVSGTMPAASGAVNRTS